MGNPIDALFHSRKFLVLLLDTVLSIILYFIGRYGGEPLATDTKFLIGILQPLFLTMIYAIAKEDAAALSAPNNISVSPTAEAQKGGNGTGTRG